MDSTKLRLLMTKTGVKIRCVGYDDRPIKVNPAIGLPMWVHDDEAIGGWRGGKRIMARKSQRRYGGWLMGVDPSPT